MKNCNKCQKEAFVQTNADVILCKTCFTSVTEKKVKQAIKKYKMIQYESKIAIGLSGGKDSVVLMHILKKILGTDVKLFAIIVDEGVEGYRPHGIEIAVKNAEKLLIPAHVVSYKNYFGNSLDEMMVERPLGKTSCGICGTFRRKALNKKALELQVDYLATGHNMDDEAESIMLNVVRGDSRRFTRQTREPDKFNEKLVPRIKPLVLVTQPEIVWYAIANNLEYHDDVCPYANEARRNSIREFLQKQEKSHTGTLKNIINFQDKLLEQIEEELEEKKELFDCKRCGEPTDDINMLCAGCKLIGNLPGIKE